jgi:monoamine oxidase
MRVLEDRGLRTCVVEARDRIGGRIHTVRDERLPDPIELGAEFIHGSAPALVALMQEARLSATVIEGERWRRRASRLSQFNDFWKRLDVVMRRLPSRGRDRSFDEFLESAPGGRGAADNRRISREFVEGFQAADASRISALALADGGSPGDDVEEQRMMRPADGYHRVVAWLARGLEDRISTRSIVEDIAWERGAADLRVRGVERTSRRISARAVIVTVPLGVLLADVGESGAINFSPALPRVNHVRDRLTMGSAVRVIVLFRERWWEKKLRSAPRGVTLDALSFLHGDSRNFPVWWTLHPAHVPAMVGWAGGPAALRMAGLSKSEIRERAVRALAHNFGVATRSIDRTVEDCWTHDWDSDPYSRGAYSYALVGGAKEAALLARPTEQTIWIAGEAADSEGRNGTVHGAIESGRRAARSIARGLA